MAARVSAALRLRGPAGPLKAEITWPEHEPAAVLVFIGEADPSCRALGDALQAVTLSAACETHQDARAALEWTGDHAAQLGADPSRLILAAAGPAAVFAAQAACEEWPAIERLVLIDPELGDDTPLPQVPVAIVARGELAAVR